MDVKKIYLSRIGYEEYLNRIEQLNQEFYRIGLLKKEASEQAPGDGWHDNFAYEDAMRQEKQVMRDIQDLQEKRKNIEIVQRKGNNDVVDIGDEIELEMIYSDSDIEIETFQLVGNYFTKDDYEITLNSPLGRAIYQQKIGSLVEYKVNENNIKVKILRKK